MRKSVNSRLFLMRKKLDNLLHVLFPNSWIPLYTMVSYLNISGILYYVKFTNFTE